MNIKSISVDKDVLSGTPVFNGTRVPITILFDYLEDDKLNEFLTNYPTVSKEQINEVIRFAGKLVSDNKVVNESLN